MDFPQLTSVSQQLLEFHVFPMLPTLQAPY